MAWQYEHLGPRREDYDTEEEYQNALDAYEQAKDDYYEAREEERQIRDYYGG